MLEIHRAPTAARRIRPIPGERSTTELARRIPLRRQPVGLIDAVQPPCHALARLGDIINTPILGVRRFRMPKPKPFPLETTKRRTMAIRPRPIGLAALHDSCRGTRCNLCNR